MFAKDDQNIIIKKLNQAETDLDTEIIFRRLIKLDNLDAVHEKWRFDGVVAESVIFNLLEVDASHEDKLVSLLEDNLLIQIGSVYTVKQSNDGLLFINFNFNY